MKMSIWAAVVAALVLCLAGCSTTSDTRKKGEQSESVAYEQAYQNERDRADSLAAANVVNHTRKIDLELKVDLATLASQAKADPTTWTTVAIAAETTRLQAVHDQRIADYATAMNASEALRTKNEAINLGAARKIRDTMNPPPPVAPVSLAPAINASAGTPPPVPLVPPK